MQFYRVDDFNENVVLMKIRESRARPITHFYSFYITHSQGPGTGTVTRKTGTGTGTF